jgi:hypothetical protein
VSLAGRVVSAMLVYRLATAISVENVYGDGTTTCVVSVGALTACGTNLAIPNSLVVLVPTPANPTANAADMAVYFVGQPWRGAVSLRLGGAVSKLSSYVLVGVGAPRMIRHRRDSCAP